jgi:alpha-beta hydrolase superfamily lysophospholipase
MKYLVGLPGWLAERGVSSLVIDQPGTGEALRLHGMTARFDAEHWARHVVDWLEQRDDVDASRIGCEGVSLGGYYCPRVVAMEPRFACGVVWGANHDWRDVQKKRLEKEGDFPCRITGSTSAGYGVPRMSTTSCASPRTCTWMAWSRRSACLSWSPTARRTRRFR